MSSTRLGQDERLPLYQRLRDEIAARIAAGDWLPGELIPTEAELTQRYGVATGTVRKAVDTLVNEGLLQRRQGRGTFVRRPSFDSSFMRFFRQKTGSRDGTREVPTSRLLTRQCEQPPDAVGPGAEPGQKGGGHPSAATAHPSAADSVPRGYLAAGNSLQGADGHRA